MVKSSLLSVLIFLCILSNLIAQTNRNYRFINFGKQHGLPEKYIYCTTQDSLGFMWFGTASGLYRFDGYNFRVFKSPINKPGRTIANMLTAIYCDRQHNLWLGSVNDLQWYNPKVNKFWTPDENIHEVAELKNSYILHFSEDSKHQIWISTSNNGFFRFDPKDSTFTHFKSFIPEKLSSFTARVFEASNGNYYSIHPHGLIQFNTNTGNYKHYPFPGNIINNGFYDAELNKIFLTTYGSGVLAFNIESNTFSKNVFNNETLNKAQNFSIIKGPDNRFLIGSESLFIFEPFQNKLESFNNINNSEYSLKCSKIGNFYVDRQKNVWFLSYNGLSMLPWNNQQIHSVNLIHPKTKNAISTTVSLELPDTKDLLIGNYDAGLIRFDRIHNSLTYIPNPLANNQNQDGVTILIKQSNGTVYASDGINIFRFLVQENTLIPVNIINNSGKSIAKFKSSIVDNKDNAYLESGDGGCYKLNLNDWKLTKINKYEIDSLSAKAKENTLTPCFKDSKGVIWFTSNPGLYSYDPHTNQWVNYSAYLDLSTLYSTSSIEEDLNGHYWITSLTNGLFELYFENSKPKIINYNQESKCGLQSDYLIKILKEPHTRNLWIYSLIGLIRFDPVSKQVISSINQQNGLTTTDLIQGLISSDQKMYIFQFGNADILDLKTYQINDYKKSVTISSFKIANKDIGNYDEFEVKPYRINYAENFLNFEFSNLEMANSNQVRYAYKLEDVDDSWIEIGNTNHLSFSRLNPGKYELQLKAVNNDGVESEGITKFPFVISPLFWNTWWFRGLLLSIVGGLITLFMRYRIQSIKGEELQKQEFQKKIADVEMKALRAQMNPHFIFNSLNSIQKYILKKDHQTAAQYLTKFARLMRLILDHSDQNYIMLSSELELLRLYIEMEGQRFDHAFKCHFEVDPRLNVEVLEIPSMLIQPYVENAIWHGLLHKEEPGNLYLKFILKSDKLVEVIIEDDGVGRAKAFELKSKQVLRKKSYGMQITENRIAILNRIHQFETKCIIEDLVEDNTAKGTRITITIPIKTQMT